MEEALQAPNGVQLENFKRWFRRTRWGSDVRMWHQRNQFSSQVQTEKQSTRRPKPSVCPPTARPQCLRYLFCFFLQRSYPLKGARLFCLNSLCLCVSVAMWTIHYLVKCAVFRRQDKHPYLMILFFSLFSSIPADVQHVFFCFFFSCTTLWKSSSWLSD